MPRPWHAACSYVAQMQHKRLTVRVCVCECVGHPSCPSTMALCIRMCACNFPWEIYANKITNKFYNFMCKPCRRHTHASVSHWVIHSLSHSSIQSLIHSFIRFVSAWVFALSVFRAVSGCLFALQWLHSLCACGRVCLSVCVRVAAEVRHKS